MLENSIDEENSEPLMRLDKIDFDIKDLLSDQEESNEEKNILLYNAKPISIFKLICHLSGKLEIFLMLIAFISTIFSGCTNSLWGIMMGNTINELTNILMIESLPDEEYKKEVDKLEQPINKLVYYFILLGALTFVSNFLMLFLWGFSALRQMHKLKKNYFELILNQDQSWFDENNEYEFATKIQTQLEQIEFGLGDRFGQIILMVSEIFSGLSVGFAISWSLTLIIVASFPLIIISVLISDYFAEKLLLKSKDLNEKAGGISEELLYNIKTVTSFCNFDFELNRYNQLIDEMDKYDQKKVLIESIAYGLLYVAAFGSFALTIFHAKSLKVNHEIKYSDNKPYNGGDFVTVALCVLNVIYSVSGLGPNFQIIQKAGLASSDYFVLLSKYRKQSKINNGYIPAKEDFKGKIEFKNVKFIYPHDKTKKVVLDDLNLVIEPGKKIALIGESGCGKSTTINLIEKFYEANAGQILIDGKDIKEYDIENLRDLMGYVQQEPVLFNTSIKDNIVFGRERKLLKLGSIDQMVKESCDEAYIRKFIEKNEDKYDYIVGIKGGKLSAGQKQRIAIARAILMKPKILILDEATSSLDNKSEKEVQKALDNICKKEITIFIISHRLSTIKNSDLIYVMKDGKIIEKGKHQELLEKNGYYFGLIREQLTADEISQLNEKNDIKKLNTSSSLIYDNFDLDEDFNDNEFLPLNQDLSKNEEKQKIKISLKRLYNLISDHKCSLFLGVLSGLVYGSISPIVGVFLGKTVNSFSSLDLNKVEEDSIKFVIFYILVSIIGGLSIFIKMWKMQSLGLIISIKIKKKIFEKYLELQMSYYDNNKNSPGALTTKLAIDSSQLDTLLLNLLGGTLTVISTLIISFILGIVYDWKITLILFVFVPLMIYGIIKKDDYKENGRESNKLSKIESGSFLSECVVNMKTIFSFNFHSKAIKIYEDYLNTEKKYFLKNSLLQGFWIGFALSVYNFAFGIAYKCGFIFLKNRSVDFESLACCVYNIVNSCDGLSDILRNMGDSGKAKLAYKSVFDTLDLKIDIDPFEENNRSKLGVENIKGKIEFKNVYFSYPTKPDQLILKDLSFTINPGQNIGLVGLSGSGKSTIINLIERFYDVNQGEILIDDKNIKEYNLYQLRKKIGLVSQEPAIFKRNVYENILYGKLDSKKEDVFRIAQKAEIQDLLSYKDYEKKDNPLSGGQKQRVAIARAFIKDPQIILLDEATSSMDKETESEVQKNIYELNKNKTCISIAHRLSTIINSDEIFVLDDGELVEQGTHEELINLKGKYYTLYKYSKK